MDNFDFCMTSAYLTTLHLQITLLHPSFQEHSIWSQRKGDTPCKPRAKYFL